MNDFSTKELNLPKGICYLCFPKEKIKIKSKPLPKAKQSLPKILQSKLK